MKISKIFAAMSAAALAAATLSAVSASAEEKVANEFYPADGTTSGVYTYTYTGDQIAAAVEAGGAQFTENADPEGGPSTYTCGFNIQTGHQTDALITMKVTSSKANIYNGDVANPGTEDYLYTVKASWTGKSPADSVENPIKYNEENAQKGAAEVNGWDSGSEKFNGNWVQFMMTDDDLSSVTIEVTVDNSNSTWEYHEYDAEKSEEENSFTIFRMFGSPSTIDETVTYDEIFSKGGTTNGTESTDSKDSTASGSDSTASSSSSKSGGSSTSSTKSGGSGNNAASTKTSTSTAAGTSDNTANAESGAAAGVGLAIAALAGAAIVVSRKK